jgi:tRNA threonylcarbamoyladenosine biosynthesis protein TsaB
MRLLAVDASTECCSAALWQADRLELRSAVTERSHADLLLPMIDELLRLHDLRATDLDGYAFGCGPGGFTGLRLAAGIVQGLAFATGRRVASVSSLAAVAWQVEVPDREAVLVCNDARMGEVYVGCFRRVGDALETLTTERVLPPDRVLDVAAGARHVAGNGCARHATLAAALRGAGLQFHDGVYPRADAVARLGLRDFALGRTVEAAEVVPAYVRNDVARPSGGPVTPM